MESERGNILLILAKEIMHWLSFVCLHGCLAVYTHLYLESYRQILV